MENKKAFSGFTSLIYKIRPTLEPGYSVFEVETTSYNFVIKAINSDAIIETIIIAKAWVEEYVNKQLIAVGIPPIQIEEMEKMTKNIWVVSDTHFNHANILKFEDSVGKPVRLFNSVEEMNEVMIQNWNKVVKPGDKVYHLGDVVFGQDKDGWLAKNMPRLKGQKRLIFGNHDEPSRFVGKGQFTKTALWRHFKEFNILMTHVPVHPSTLGEVHRWENDSPVLNVHGHIHQNKSPDGPYHCVCVEQTNYTPVNIEDLAAIARRL